jgi:hypothetical protein
MRRLTLSIIFLAVLFSCGKSTDEQTADTILSANIAMSNGNCQSAVDMLEGLGRQYKNAYYLKALSAAYSCLAGFNTTIFFASDMANTASPSPLGGMSTYSTSLTTFQSPLENDPKFIHMQAAIDLLLYAGGIASTTEPFYTERAKYFSSGVAADINSQLLFLMLAQFGRYMKVYTNTSAAGVKGGGTASNVCFTSYSNISTPLVLAGLAAQAGACKVTNSSHAETSSLIASATRRRRLCHGVVLLNGILNVLPGVVAGASGGSLAAISGMTAAITLAQSAMTTADPSIGVVATTLNQTTCEDASSVPIDKLESYFALMMEGIIN